MDSSSITLAEIWAGIKQSPEIITVSIIFIGMFIYNILNKLSKYKHTKKLAEKILLFGTSVFGVFLVVLGIAFGIMIIIGGFYNINDGGRYAPPMNVLWVAAMIALIICGISLEVFIFKNIWSFFKGKQTNY